MKSVVYIFSLLLVLAGCTGTSRQPQLVAADSLLQTSPDSSLQQLKRMDVPQSRADRMYYYLLLADAANKCYDTLPSDSIMQEVADFYDSHGSANEQVRAHYMLGCVYRDEGNSPKALKCYHDASEMADTLSKDCNFRLLSCIYGQIADLYNAQRAPRLELRAQRKAADYAWKANDTVSSIIFYANMCRPYHMLNMMDSTLYYSQKGAEKFRNIGRKDLAARTLGFDIDIYLRRRDYDKVKISMDEYEANSGFFDEEGNTKKGAELYYSFKGNFYEGIGLLDSAEYYYYKLLRLGKQKNTEEAAYKGLLSLYQKSGKSDSISKYANLYCQTNDSASFTHSAEEITRMQAIYNYDASERKAEQNERKADTYRATLFVIAIIIVLVGYWILYFIKRQKQLNIKKLAKANAEYTSLLSKYIQIQEDLNSAVHGFDSYQADKEKTIKELQKSLSSYQEVEEQQKKWDASQAMLHNAIVLRMHELAGKAEKASEEEWRSLNQFAIKNMEPFLDKICDEKLNLTEKEIRICILSRLQFIPSEMAVLLDLSKQRITNIKANANKKLFYMTGAQSFDSNIKKLD